MDCVFFHDLWKDIVQETIPIAVRLTGKRRTVVEDLFARPRREISVPVFDIDGKEREKGRILLEVFNKAIGLLPVHSDEDEEIGGRIL